VAPPFTGQRELRDVVTTENSVEMTFVKADSSAGTVRWTGRGRNVTSLVGEREDRSGNTDVTSHQ
jgi:hypothetical protein